MKKNLKMCLCAGALMLALTPAVRLSAQSASNIQRVLLISIDGMHAVDFINCANGVRE